MDLNAIKAKLEALNSNGQEREKTDYTKIFWKPQIGEQTIRLVPSAFNPTMPFKEMKFHYGVGKYPMVALSNFGKQDPVEEFVAELKKTSDKDNWSLAGKLTPKTRIFAPVVVRGEEEKGVRLWGFGITIYKALLAIVADEDYGDITDPVNGTDLTLTMAQGNPYPETSVRPKRNSSGLSEKADEVDIWLKSQPNPEEVHNEYDYNYIKKQLQMYLDPNAVPTSPTAPAAGVTPAPAIATKESDFTLETASAGNKDTVSKFDDLFNE
jgi:hypothetical protein|tara:strand:+ start:7317 stop:8117 length:801 start_codon:yes stop_codon:yes gene_type:complete